MSFSCPHFDPFTDRCDRVRDLCVCGRPGCVLARNSVFAVPPAQRLADATRVTLHSLATAPCPTESPKPSSSKAATS